MSSLVTTLRQIEDAHRALTAMHADVTATLRAADLLLHVRAATAAPWGLAPLRRALLEHVRTPEGGAVVSSWVSAHLEQLVAPGAAPPTAAALALLLELADAAAVPVTASHLHLLVRCGRETPERAALTLACAHHPSADRLLWRSALLTVSTTDAAPEQLLEILYGPRARDIARDPEMRQRLWRLVLDDRHPLRWLVAAWLPGDPVATDWLHLTEWLATGGQDRAIRLRAVHALATSLADAPDATSRLGVLAMALTDLPLRDAVQQVAGQLAAPVRRTPREVASLAAPACGIRRVDGPIQVGSCLSLREARFGQPAGCHAVCVHVALFGRTTTVTLLFADGSATTCDAQELPSCCEHLGVEPTLADYVYTTPRRLRQDFAAGHFGRVLQPAAAAA